MKIFSLCKTVVFYSYDRCMGINTKTHYLINYGMIHTDDKINGTMLWGIVLYVLGVGSFNFLYE